MVIGLVKEAHDKRSPLSPNQCKILQDTFGIKVIVEPSSIRCFNNTEYSECGIELDYDLSMCDIIFGVKEINKDKLIPNKTYVFFSHTIKSQPHNMDMLKSILEKNITLIDYECIRYKNKRVIGFGYFAGIVGVYEAIIAYGKRYGYYDIVPAKTLSDVHYNMKYVDLSSINMVVCGDGNVSRGVIDTINMSNIKYTHLRSEDLYKKNGIYNKEDFRKYPYTYSINFDTNWDIMVNCVYWHDNIPRFFSYDDMLSDNFNIKVISDISCDINGSVPIPRCTSIEDPVMRIGNTDVIAISNLPCELPIDSSIYFGDNLSNIMNLIINDDDIIKEATICRSGCLTDKYKYIYNI